MLLNNLYHLGDQLEDRVRGKLSHYPLVYAFIGGAGVVIFWRGIWHTTDFLMEHFFVPINTLSSTSERLLPWWDGPLSIVVGALLLLMTGLFVSNFIGNEIIISGIKGEKRLMDKTEQEIKDEVTFDIKILNEMRDITVRLKTIEKNLQKSTAGTTVRLQKPLVKTRV